jgi:hypothetical protein
MLITKSPFLNVEEQLDRLEGNVKDILTKLLLSN